MRLLAKEKAERPASAEEVLTELEHAGQELAGGQPGAPTAVRITEERPLEQEIRFCTSADGTRIAYATYGDPAARALVHVSPFPFAQESSWNYPEQRATYEALASGRRLVTFDSRGVGGSQRDVDDLAISAQVADLAAVVNELGLERFDLIAYASGAAPGAAYAVDHPERVRRLVLWQPINVRTSDSPLPAYEEMTQLIRANWALARRSWAALVYPNGPTELQRWFSNMVRDSLTPEVAARHFEVIAEFDGRAILQNIQTPTLVCSHSGAHRVEITSVRTVASLITDARLVVLEGATNTLGVVEPYLAAIRSFLDEADAETRAAN
ncbi:MAG: alpha/beta fold hydrolase [Chloroflexi bacterium]|nr:alpha/beta fold hydrolase [Chloroflexota bacterium]